MPATKVTKKWLSGSPFKKSFLRVALGAHFLVTFEYFELMGISQGRTKQHKHQLLVRISRRHAFSDPYARKPWGQKVSPHHWDHKKMQFLVRTSMTFGADVHEPKGCRKTLYKKTCIDLLAPIFRRTQEGCGGLGGENPAAFPQARPNFQQPFSLPESAQTLAGRAFRTAGKPANHFAAASKFAGKPFQQGMSADRKRGQRKGAPSKNVKNRQKVSKIFPTLLDNFRAGQKTSKIVKKCQKYFRYFSTIFARHPSFPAPFGGL